MSKKQYKKRHHSSTVAAKRRAEQERIADEKDRARKRMNPTARNLLFGDLIFLAVISLLDTNHLLSPALSAVSTIVGVILLLIALWFQFVKKESWKR